MKKIIGSFYFKINKDGTLTGKFLSLNAKNVSDENAYPILPGNGFIGNFNASWNDTNSHKGILKITDTISPNIYNLIWIENGSVVNTYEGEGFIEDNILIGHYWGF